MLPQLVIIPSEVKAKECNEPAAIATTLLKPGGTSVCPAMLSPQAITVPLFLRASAWELPQAIATMLDSPKGKVVEPQVVTVLSFNSAIPKSSPIAMETAPEIIGGNGAPPPPDSV